MQSVAEPVLLVNWPAGQSRQEVEAGAGWYVETGQEVQAPAEAYLPAGQAVQSARRAEPVPVVKWPAGHSRQEVEAAVGWYVERGQKVQTPASRYPPAGQPVQSARRAEPVALVNWPAGQSRHEVEPGSGWYLEAGQEVQTAGQEAPSDEQACVCVGGSWHVLEWYVLPPASLEMSRVPNSKPISLP